MPFEQQWSGAGSEFLPCEAGILTWEFNLAGPSMATQPVTLHIDGATYPSTQTSDFSYSFTSPGAGVTTSSNVFVSYFAESRLQESAVSIVSCDTEETTSTSPTESTNTSPTESTNTSPTESTNTSPTESTNTSPTQSTSTSPSESTKPSESTRTSPNESTLPSESTRPVPTAVDAGVSGPTSGGGSSHLGSVLGVLGGLALASAGAFALMRRRGQHEA